MGTMGKRQRTFLHKQDGSVILETALMIGVLLVLTFGMIDFGRVMYLSNNLISAAREGARGGAVMTSPVSVSAVKTIVKGRFNSYTFGGDNLKDADITVTDNSTSSPPSVRVQIAYSFNWLSPLPAVMAMLGQSGWRGSTGSTLHAAAEYRYESP
jgi:Flp pilus assembly protein TadG